MNYVGYEIKGNWLRLVNIEGTRVGIHLKEIKDWVARPEPNSKVMFWICNGNFGIEMSEEELEVLLCALERF